MTERRKPGRPTTAPKVHTLKIRFDEGTKERLETCCKQLGLNKSELLRRGVRLQYEALDGKKDGSPRRAKP